MKLRHVLLLSAIAQTIIGLSLAVIAYECVVSSDEIQVRFVE